MTAARPAIIEIVERRPKPEQDSLSAAVCVPNEIRINGQEVLIPKGEPITVRDINVHDNVVMVTLTVFAQRVFIGHEDITPAEPDPIDVARGAVLDAQRDAVDARLEAERRVAQAQHRLAEALREAGHV